MEERSTGRAGKELSRLHDKRRKMAAGLRRDDDSVGDSGGLLEGGDDLTRLDRRIAEITESLPGPGRLLSRLLGVLVVLRRAEQAAGHADHTRTPVLLIGVALAGRSAPSRTRYPWP